MNAQYLTKNKEKCIVAYDFWSPSYIVCYEPFSIMFSSALNHTFWDVTSTCRHFKKTASYFDQVGRLSLQWLHVSLCNSVIPLCLGSISLCLTNISLWNGHKSLCPDTLPWFFNYSNYFTLAMCHCCYVGILHCGV